MVDHAWLPELICLADFGGNWNAYFDAVYQCFVRDFIASKPVFRGKALGLKRIPYTDGREATFWHLISKGDDEETDEDDRTPDLRRCERIAWPKPVIEHETDATLKVWEQPYRSELRVHIWVEAKDYVVVLARRKAGKPDEYVLPWTAYVVDSDQYRRKLQKRFTKYAPKG